MHLDYLDNAHPENISLRFSCRSLHSAISEEHLDGGGNDQGAGGGEQRDCLHRCFHRPGASKSSHHTGQSSFYF